MGKIRQKPVHKKSENGAERRVKKMNCANNLIDIRKHSAAKTVILLYYLFGENIAGPVK